MLVSAKCWPDATWLSLIIKHMPGKYDSLQPSATTLSALIAPLLLRKVPLRGSAGLCQKPTKNLDHAESLLFTESGRC